MIEDLKQQQEDIKRLVSASCKVLGWASGRCNDCNYEGSYRKPEEHDSDCAQAADILELESVLKVFAGDEKKVKV